jgi:hypothetical protein
MTSRLSITTLSVALGVLLVFAFLVLVSWAVIDNALTVYATPEMQSPFLQAYNPNQAFDRFRDSTFSGSRGSAAGAGAGRGFATHEKSIDQELIMQWTDGPALLSALENDTTSLLAATGAQILSHTGNDIDGFHIRYVEGKSTGTVVIKPPERIPNPEQYWRQPLHPGEAAVWVRIRIEETWFKAGVPSQHGATFLPRLQGS